MGEKRKKSATVLLRIPSKKAVKIELFPAAAWSGRTDVVPGSFRLRQDLAWVSLGGGRYEFLGREAVGQYLAALLAGEVAEEPTPQLRARNGRCSRPVCGMWSAYRSRASPRVGWRSGMIGEKCNCLSGTGRRISLCKYILNEILLYKY